MTYSRADIRIEENCFEPKGEVNRRSTGLNCRSVEWFTGKCYDAVIKINGG
ncbi:hypothetical protein CLOSYM_00229 [[Clostridium] symbiosum ATCC 14940]|uniref:Uncharacterized protein n=1 Tax=[Clostridium] symbiosum ATCC 14940 TaxID=411472 RepID=A0ABC9U3U0_CLOSY|nr:hypothetical protein CLOSYM_00229 [[Clostridium] symbiosum ATCC 14940]